MKKKSIFIILAALVFSLVLSSCTSNNVGEGNLQVKLKEKDEKITELENKILELEKKEQGINLQDNLVIRAIEVINLISDKDMNTLSEYIHPTKGVRFTPYPYVNVEEDKVFTSEELSAVFDDDQVYTWGAYDGSGAPIELNFEKYYNEFIYDEDFANPQLIGNNIIIGEGNTIDNVVEAYPDSRFIELYFSGFDSQYGGMDWRSLKLVFEEEDGEWYLVGIIHGEWTI